jgi:hypothetical protein
MTKTRRVVVAFVLGVVVALVLLFFRVPKTAEGGSCRDQGCGTNESCVYLYDSDCTPGPPCKFISCNKEHEEDESEGYGLIALPLW